MASVWRKWRQRKCRVGRIGRRRWRRKCRGRLRSIGYSLISRKQGLNN